MRLNRLLVVLSAIFVICAAAPATAPAEDKKELISNAVDLLEVNTDTGAAHENESNRKARQFLYPYGGYYGGYGGLYGGYGLYGYRSFPYAYGYGYYPFSGYYPYYG